VTECVTLSEAKGAMCGHGPLRFAQGDTFRQGDKLGALTTATAPADTAECVSEI
jgi:hypothetical protein